MRRKGLVVAVVLLVILGLFYSVQQTQNDQIHIYVMRSSAIHEKYNIDRTPTVTERDIAWYDWETHEIKLKTSYIEKMKDTGAFERYDFAFVGGSAMLDCVGTDRFQIVVNGEKLYEGRVEGSGVTSYLPDGAILRDTDEGIMIYVGWGDDLRSDERLYSALKNNNLLKD